MDATKKAIDKDDKEKMGPRANDVFKKVNKKMMLKNEESKLLATTIEKLLDGDRILDSIPTPNPLISSVDRIIGTKEDKASIYRAVNQGDYDKAMELIKTYLREKGLEVVDEQRRKEQQAIDYYKATEGKVSQTIFSTMSRSVPLQIRETIATVIKGFESGELDRKRANEILGKNFSNDTFESIMKCLQGEIDACEQVKMEHWEPPQKHTHTHKQA